MVETPTRVFGAATTETPDEDLIEDNRVVVADAVLIEPASRPTDRNDEREELVKRSSGQCWCRSGCHCGQSRA